MSEIRIPIGNTVRVRKDIRSLEKDELDLLIDAWVYIQNQLPDKDSEDNPNTKSFFTIAGFHGEPFRGAGYSNATWWGGYCNHGNILFPTWHRAYLLSLENALRKAPGCENISLPYWNQLPTVLPPVDSSDSPYSSNPIPEIFLQKEYVYHRDGKKIKNPLYSYQFQKQITDQLQIATSSVPGSDVDYSKPKGYETVRYPFSGLVGEKNLSTTKAHNELMNMLGEARTTEFLQSNVANWLAGTVKNSEGQEIKGGSTQDNYIRSLFAPDYTVYSNTTSAQRYNDDNFDDNLFTGGGNLSVVPIERPHNAIHLAVGGYEIPGVANYNFVPGANGDMGENDTASFDPIFFFHHCFIDFMFWAWQLKHGGPEEPLTIRPKYPGTNSVDSQGPTPGTTGGSWLTLDSPLDPFINEKGEPLTSNTVADIVKLGYNYDDSLLKALVDLRQPNVGVTREDAHIRISGLSRGDAKGSFFLSAWASDPDTEGGPELVAVVPVLSRWHVAGCANCSTHLNVTAVASVGMSSQKARRQNFEVLVHTRDRKYGHAKLGGKKPDFSLGNFSA